MRELIVDSFAGGGGASLGISWATGRGPDIAINHDAAAIAMHRANHPETLHLSKNIWKVDPTDYVAGRKVGLAWFSPDCKHFSKAKGAAPVKRNIRDLAWVVVRWAKQVRPRIICLENVEEFQDWGPVGLDDKPCKARKGETFEKWKGELGRLGYKIEHRTLRACDFGAPTIRKRFFLIARCDGRPIIWPEPTHGAPTSDGVVSGVLQTWRTAAEIIDWSLPCHSIFLSKTEGRALGVKRPLAENTMARIAKGVQRYVIDAAEPFIVTCNHGGDWFRGQGLDDPFNTVTAARDAHGLVTPFVSTYYGPKRPGDVRGQDLGHPLKTQTTENRHALVAPFITKFRNGSTGHRADEPLHTVTASSHVKRPAGATPLAVVAPYFVPRYGERPPQYKCLKCGEIFIDPHAAGVGGLAPAECPRCGEEEGIVERPGQEPRTRAPDKPAATVTTTANNGNLVAAFLAQHNTGVVGHDAHEPVSTIVQKGCTQGVVASHLINLKGAKRRQAPVDRPAPTQTAGGWHIGEVRAFLIKYNGQGVGQAMDEPCHTTTSKERFGLVQVEGQDYQIVDIGMRMLSPRELFRAQGFPDDYIIDPEHNGKPLTKTVQISCCGNSVPPQWAEAIVRANYVEDQVEAVA